MTPPWRAIRLTVLTLAFAPAYGLEQLQFRLPLECVPGASCWIANHVDLAPGAGARDYACGGLTYDGHKGTDFALRDLRAMAQGVRVLAAAPGIVAAVRDREPDISVRERGLQALEGKDCGNGVRVRHGDDWQTQYCHLRRGSVAVKPGDRVPAGAVIGEVGLSGKTEYPHLHFTVRRGARVVDPFRGESGARGCGPGTRPLWDPATLAKLPYAPGSIFNYGVATALPRAQHARAGALRGRVIAANARLFAVWAEVFGVRAGDMLAITVRAPDGSRLIAHRGRIAKRQARIFRSVARKRRSAVWPPGEYQVRIALEQAEGSRHSARDARFAVQVRE